MQLDYKPDWEPETLEDQWYSPDAIAARNDYWFSRTFFGVEAIPMWSAGYPGIAAFPPRWDAHT